MSEIRATEAIARENIQGYLDEIQGYANPTNDGNLAAWMMARYRAEALVEDLNTVCKAIAARPRHYTGNEAMRAIAALPEEIPTETPEEAEELDRIERSHPDPNFAALSVLDDALRIVKPA